mmetsp:Transcript_22613/g.71158  ORF Transcript_22613/g.71158 Transcript_22613/m.71158 type:complete len:202 (+) Transcript_22613:1138-1743(+)
MLSSKRCALSWSMPLALSCWADNSCWRSESFAAACWPAMTSSAFTSSRVPLSCLVLLSLASRRCALSASDVSLASCSNLSLSSRSPMRLVKSVRSLVRVATALSASARSFSMTDLSASKRISVSAWRAAIADCWRSSSELSSAAWALADFCSDSSCALACSRPWLSSWTVAALASRRLALSAAALSAAARCFSSSARSCEA